MKELGKWGRKRKRSRSSHAQVLPLTLTFADGWNMQAVTAHTTSFAWSRRFKSAGGRDIVGSLFVEKRVLLFRRKRGRCRSVFNPVYLCCASRFGSLGRLQPHWGLGGYSKIKMQKYGLDLESSPTFLAKYLRRLSRGSEILRPSCAHPTHC